MENPRTAAQRIRPILDAMERSIDSARRKRTHEPEPAMMGVTAPVNAARSVNAPAGPVPAGAIAFNAAVNRMIGSAAAPASAMNNPVGVVKPGAQPALAPLPTDPNQPVRQKARAKPVNPFLNDSDDKTWQSQAS